MTMRKIVGFFIFILSLFAIDFMPLKEVKKGQKGYGISVFTGTKPQKFGVEILGVLKNFNVDSSLIMARLTGKYVENGGVISGMSGSPVFINGKLVGALAYGFQFSKEPIAGIVPIGEIVRGSSFLTIGSARAVYSGPIRKRLKFSTLLSFLSSPSSIGKFTPLPIPFSATVEGDFVDKFARRMNLISAGSGAVPVEPKIKLESISEGDAVSILLTTGDIEISAGGTVIYNDRKENRVYIFGHPFLNTGPANYFLAKAEVLGIVPSYATPFKLMQSTTLLGRVIEDRQKGVVAELGKLPAYIPVRLKLASPKKEKKYKFWLIDDPNLAPVLLMMAEQGVLSEGAKDYGDISLRVKGEIALKNGRNVKISDIFVGKSSSEVLSIDAAILYYLENNPYKRADIDSIILNFDVYEYEKSATIARIWTPKYRVKPGEKVDITVYIKPKDGKEQEQTYPIKIPEVPAGKDLYLMVASAEAISKWEATYYRGVVGFPASFDRLVRVLNNLRKNNRLYFKFFTRDKSLYIEGEEFPSLPPTLFQLFSSPYQPIRGRVLRRATVVEYTSELPWFIKGSKIIKFSTWSGQ